jgi:FkbM family methyltransferase
VEIQSIKINGLTIEGYKGDYIFETLRNTEKFYEIDILEKWALNLKDSKVIFDIGANLGNHSLYWATAISPELIFSFEPYPANFLCLQNNINNNNLGEKVKAIQKGIGDKVGYAAVKEVDEANLGGTSFKYVQTEEADKVEIISIDSFIIENKIPSVDFIKIDTEGFEVLVLQGMKQTIRDFKPAVWVEVSYTSYREVMDLFKEEGYVLYDIEQFNLLFLHPDKQQCIAQYENSTILDGFFKYLDKTNQYYKAYNTAKHWLEDRNKSMDKMRDEFDSHIKKSKEEVLKLKKEAEDLEAQYLKKVTEWETKYNNLSLICEDLRQQIKGKSDLESQYIKTLSDCTNEDDIEIQFLQSIKSYIMKLETQNNYLKRENEEYRKKIAKITDTLIGRLGIKLYRLTKKIKAKFTKFK